MRGFSVWNKRARVLPIFLVRSCQDLLEHKSWPLYSAQNLCIIVLNSSFHSASDQTKITFVYGWYISSSFSSFFAAIYVRRIKVGLDIFAKKIVAIFFQTKSFVFGCGRVSTWDEDYYIDGRNTRFCQWGRILNSNNATQIHSIFVKL